MIKILLALLFLIPLQGYAKKAPQYDLALLAIFKNEAHYLKEWIEFHKLVGVKHFYLYNHLSTDHYKEVLQPYIKRGEVELINWKYPSKTLKEWAPIQRNAYEDGIKRAKGKAKWLAIIDVDEFLFPTEKMSLTQLLKDYEEFGAVCANWKMFGTSHIPKIADDQLLIEMLVWRAPILYEENSHVKSIVRPDRVLKCGGPHYCHLIPGYKQVNSHKQPFEGSRSPFIDENPLLTLHHYWTRDEFFFYMYKLARREGWQEGQQAGLKRILILNSEKDETIFRYIRALKKALNH